ncbi:diguanylate cyclase [Massilia sp. H6]|uniref:sensor domain-containing diguanylate cyclase n=1 Tax=Massilia sp. H6 TaxID=2970464 RepID=UPI00216A2F35|nr:diguanylate cyclase [Massilia sp. H6]UVW26961.1 diguanylate cyclase [Massilia sp. H6]
MRSHLDGSEHDLVDETAQLRAEHEALIQFLYLAPVGLVQADLDGVIAMMNPISAQLLMPLSRDGGLDNLFTALESIAPELRHLCASFDRPSGKICDGMRVRLNPGPSAKDAPQILAITLLKLDDQRLMAVIDDITVQVRRERQLRQNDAWRDAILTGITDYALAEIDVRGAITKWNPSIGRVTGHGSEAVGQPCSIFYPPGALTPERLLERLGNADGDGWSLDEGECLRADGSRFWGSALIAPLPEREADGPAYCLILRDISDKREASERRRGDIFSDYLSGLAERRAFVDAAGVELARGQSAPRATSVISINADLVEGIHDRHGQAGTDQVLQHLAAILSETFRAVDLVARIGGEQFAVLLPSTDLKRAVLEAERLRAAVASQALDVEGSPTRYTVSAGVACFEPGEGAPGGIDALLRRADQALRAAARAGGNRVERWHPALAANPANLPQPEGGSLAV